MKTISYPVKEVNVLASKRAYQVQREQLSDRQWDNFCRLMELSRELKRRVLERRAALKEQDQP